MKGSLPASTVKPPQGSSDRIISSLYWTWWRKPAGTRVTSSGENEFILPLSQSLKNYKSVGEPSLHSSLHWFSGGFFVPGNWCHSRKMPGLNYTLGNSAGRFWSLLNLVFAFPGLCLPADHPLRLRSQPWCHSQAWVQSPWPPASHHPRVTHHCCWERVSALCHLPVSPRLQARPTGRGASDSHWLIGSPRFCASCYTWRCCCAPQNGGSWRSWHCFSLLG